ncbi:paired amphipathic helix protein SIN3 4-like [Trifolium pratense]|uniref:Paired amphipathic helix protein SIN3 4-like n=1 Tax=Trifolium pratense TaxID=57577 RepID=A0A2K3KRA9_TRIPR|nr:paired amphipathic helix protein SIN3 4-like [Trifolium pratense]
MSGSSSANNVISTDDTLVYLDEIKDAFKDEVEKFNDFIEIMRDFKERRIDVEDVASRVKELFKEHEELLMKFNNYLPDEYKISPQ